MVEKLTTGVKFDQEKVGLHYLPPRALFETAAVFTYGAEKYEPWNYAKGMEVTRLYRALLGHMMFWYAGEDVDPIEKKGSGLPHLAHASCCVQMLIETLGSGAAIDNRPKLAYPLPPELEESLRAAIRDIHVKREESCPTSESFPSK